MTFEQRLRAMEVGDRIKDPKRELYYNRVPGGWVQERWLISTDLAGNKLDRFGASTFIPDPQPQGECVWERWWDGDKVYKSDDIWQCSCGYQTGFEHGSPTDNFTFCPKCGGRITTKEENDV